MPLALTYDVPARVVAYERRVCSLADQANTPGAGAAAGEAAYRADVDWDHVQRLVRSLKRKPKLVARDERGLCTGAVPSVPGGKVRFSFPRELKVARRRFCAAVYNQNYEVDKARTAEARRVYDDLAKAYVKAAHSAGHRVRPETSAAVATSCAT